MGLFRKLAGSFSIKWEFAKMGFWVNFGLQFIRGKMGNCRNGKFQPQISRKRTKWESNFGFWRKIPAK